MNKTINLNEKNEESDEDEDDEEKKKEDEDGQNEKQLMDTMKFTLEYMKDEQDDKLYLFAKKDIGDVVLFRDIWNNIKENVLILE